jgi:hypothetical protein
MRINFYVRSNFIRPDFLWGECRTECDGGKGVVKAEGERLLSWGWGDLDIAETQGLFEGHAVFQLSKGIDDFDDRGLIDGFWDGGKADAGLEGDLGAELGGDLLGMSLLAKLNLVGVEFFSCGADQSAVGGVFVGLEVEGATDAGEVLDEEVAGDARV